MEGGTQESLRVTGTVLSNDRCVFRSLPTIPSIFHFNSSQARDERQSYTEGERERIRRANNRIRTLKRVVMESGNAKKGRKKLQGWSLRHENMKLTKHSQHHRFSFRPSLVSESVSLCSPVQVGLNPTLWDVLYICSVFLL